MFYSKYIKLTLLILLFPICCFAQLTQFINHFDYNNINKQTFVPIVGFDDTQQYHFTILKHSFEIQQSVSCPRDTQFVWNGLKGQKTIYSNDSLVLFFIRPNDTLTRPCILLTHGNNAAYKSRWDDLLKFYTLDLAMRGFCVAYYENPTSLESNYKHTYANTRKAFYNGFQAAVAADVFITEHAQTLKVDTTKLFAGGWSFGAFCSLSLTTADIGINFTDALFNNQGNFSAKTINNTSYRKNIKSCFVIGGGLPKDDTTAANNSHMGNFLNANDSNLSILFLHGRNDNFVLLDITRFGTADTVAPYFYCEGPRALINNIHANNLGVNNKLYINCNGGHPFINSVCGPSNANCIQQYQWPYLNNPADSVTSASSSYFTQPNYDTLLRLFVYMTTQINDMGYFISDFLKPAVNQTSSTLSANTYYVQVRDTFTFAAPDQHFIFKNTDCDGNPIVITGISEKYNDNNSINVYPNPTAQQLYFESKEPIQSIQIFSMIGALINEIYSNNLQQQIDVSNLANGEYICVIQLKDKIVTKKISVIR